MTQLAGPSAIAVAGAITFQNPAVGGTGTYAGVKVTNLAGLILQCQTGPGTSAFIQPYTSQILSLDPNFYRGGPLTFQAVYGTIAGVVTLEWYTAQELALLTGGNPGSVFGVSQPVATVNLAPGSSVGVNSAPSGAVPATAVATVQGGGAGSFNILPALFFGMYLLDHAVVSIQNPGVAALTELEIITQPFGGGTITTLVGPLFAVGTVTAGTPNASLIQGQEYGLGQLIVATPIEVDIIVAGAPGPSFTFCVNLFYAFSSGGQFPGHIITA